MKKLYSISICFLVATILATATSFAEQGDGEGKSKGKGHKKNPEKRFAHMDADGSGGVSLSEFKTVHEAHVARMKERREAKGDVERKRPEGERKRPTAEEIFARIDADGDGNATKAELASAHKNRKNRKCKHGKGKGNGNGKQDIDTI